MKKEIALFSAYVFSAILFIKLFLSGNTSTLPIVIGWGVLLTAFYHDTDLQDKIKNFFK